MIRSRAQTQIHFTGVIRFFSLGISRCLRYVNGRRNLDALICFVALLIFNWCLWDYLCTCYLLNFYGNVKIFISWNISIPQWSIKIMFLVILCSILFIQLNKELLETFSIYALNQILQHCNKKASPAFIQLRINAFLTFDIHNLNLNIHFNSIRIVTSLNV